MKIGGFLCFWIRTLVPIKDGFLYVDLSIC